MILLLNMLKLLKIQGFFVHNSTFFSKFLKFHVLYTLIVKFQVFPGKVAILLNAKPDFVFNAHKPPNYAECIINAASLKIFSSFLKHKLLNF